jgi:hypothetical protein
MTQEVEVSTFIEFSRTLIDTKVGFSITISIKLGEEGVSISHDYGSANGINGSSAQGEVDIKSLKSLLESCRHPDRDGVGVPVVMVAYDADTRQMKNAVEDLQIPLSEPLDFRPFLLQFLPIIIRAAELLDKNVLPQMTSTTSAKC